MALAASLLSSDDQVLVVIIDDLLTQFSYILLNCESTETELKHKILNKNSITKIIDIFLENKE